MTTFEIILSITSVVVALGVSLWMRHLGNPTGRRSVEGARTSPALPRLCPL